MLGAQLHVSLGALHSLLDFLDPKSWAQDSFIHSNTQSRAFLGQEP